MSQVRSVKIEDVLGNTYSSVSENANYINEMMEKDDLQIVIVVPTHSLEPRIRHTLGTVDKLLNDISGPRINVFVGYQGEELPYKLEKGLKDRQVSVIKSDDSKKHIGTLSRGKTENVVSILSLLMTEYNYDTDRTFVMFVDNDYLVFDTLNAQALFTQWVKSQDRKNTYVKAGGQRIVINQKAISEVSSYLEFCKYALKSSEYELDINDCLQGYLPTNDNLKNVLSTSKKEELFDSISSVSSPGGRINRSVRCYLCSKQYNQKAKFLSKFSFLLHGDQGTSLNNWLKMNLASGYMLELSFLDNIFSQGSAVVFDVKGLPHAHIPKSDNDNFQMGVDIFRYLESVLYTDMSTNTEMKNCSPQTMRSDNKTNLIDNLSTGFVIYKTVLEMVDNKRGLESVKGYADSRLYSSSRDR